MWQLARLFNAFIRTDRVRAGVFPTSADTVAATPITLTAAAAAWTWGSWAEIVAAAGVTAEQLITHIDIEDIVAAPGAEGEIQIGVGGAGSESAIGTVTINEAQPNFPMALHVNNATRIACRLRTSTGIADTCTVKLRTQTGF